MKQDFLAPILTIIFFGVFGSFIIPASAQTINVNASRFTPQVEVYFSPRSGSFIEGSTFDVPIYLNTNGESINSVDLNLNFDNSRLSIIRPAGGVSVIGVWVEPPNYDNSRGIASYVGVIPGGINTDAGLIANVTFQAKRTGQASLSFRSNSRILLNDGLGTEANVTLGRGVYSVLPAPPEGVNIYSDTHPFQSDWYNNNSPSISWDTEESVSGFSYVLDNTPNTIPDNEIESSSTSVGYEDLQDGLWYFHIKPTRSGVWGNTGHFLTRIDTTPPAEFTPEVNYLTAAPLFVERTLISFFTTDNLSGVDHYEVGVLNKADSTTVSPSFVRAESPFQVPLQKDQKLEVIVRAIDGAGNIRDVSIDVQAPFLYQKFIKENIIYILLILIGLGILLFLLHYVWGFMRHRVGYIARHSKVFQKQKKEDQADLDQLDLEQYTSTPVSHPIASQEVPKPPQE